MATPDPMPLDELFRQRLRLEIEAYRFVFGGFFTVSGGLLTSAPRYFKANGNDRVKIDAREFSLLTLLSWHGFTLAGVPAPELLEPGTRLPLEEFLAVEDILFLIESVKGRHPSIAVWSNLVAHDVYSVVNRLRGKLNESNTHPNLIESGSVGGYRLSLPPRHLQLSLDGVVYGRKDF